MVAYDAVIGCFDIISGRVTWRLSQRRRIGTVPGVRAGGMGRDSDHLDPCTTRQHPGRSGSGAIWRRSRWAPASGVAWSGLAGRAGDACRASATATSSAARTAAVAATLIFCQIIIWSVSFTRILTAGGDACAWDGRADDRFHKAPLERPHRLRRKALSLHPLPGVRSLGESAGP